jgi:hypothetical protein
VFSYFIILSVIIEILSIIFATVLTHFQNCSVIFEITTVFSHLLNFSIICDPVSHFATWQGSRFGLEACGRKAARARARGSVMSTWLRWTEARTQGARSNDGWLGRSVGPLNSGDGSLVYHPR